MTVPLRFDQLPPDRQSVIRANIAKMQAQHAPEEDIDTYLTQHEHVLPLDAQQPNALVRGGELLGNSLEQMVTHPIDSAKGMASSMKDAFQTAGGYLGQRAAELTLPPDLRKMAESDPDRISGKNAAIAGAQVGTLMLPGVGRGTSSLMEAILPKAVARTAATLGASAAAGAAFNPNDPAAGAVAGAGMAGTGEVAANIGKRMGGALIDARGARPMQTTNVMAGPIKLGTIEGISDKATRINKQVVASSPSADGMSPFSDKPVTPADVIGTAGQRAARGLKTSSPAAEAEIRSALQGRADNAVDRVIQHGLETAGLPTRESGLRLTNDLIDQRSQEGDAIWPDLYAKNPQAIDDPRIAQVFNTKSGRAAWQEVPGLMSDRFLTPPEEGTSITGNPADDKSVMFNKLVQMNGGNVNAAMKAMRALGETKAPTGGTSGVPPMNLQQLHFWAKALDDMGEPGFKRGPGSTGNGYNRGVGIQNLARTVRSIMKDNVPDAASAMTKYADKSDLIRAGDLGQDLFKMDPAAAEIAVGKMSPSEQEIFRRAGFDALAQRVENGPADVERGLSKSRDMRRMRLLWPDENSFNAFKQGLAEEGQMHANEQGVLGGSNTTDKIADIANMAGVTLPDLARTAVTGRWHRLAGQLAANVTRKMMTRGADAVAQERARQLMAGANGDVAARNQILEKLGIISPQQPPRTATATMGERPVQYNPDLLNADASPKSSGPAIGGGPLPPNRRLPAASVTGDRPSGPAIPMSGQTIDQQVRDELQRRYQEKPNWAVSLTPEKQAEIERAIRGTLMRNAGIMPKSLVDQWLEANGKPPK